MSNEVSDFYSQDNVPSSNWAKFDKVGDSYMGTFKTKFNKAWTGVMPDQVVFTLVNAKKDTLECKDWRIVKLVSSEPLDKEEELNVAIKANNTFVLSRMKNVMPWDIIWFSFVEEIAPKQKWYNPAKSITPFKKGVDEEFLKNASSPTDSDVQIEDLPFN